MERALLTLIAALSLGLAAGTASAQVAYPGQPYIGDPMADQLRYRTEVQRQRSAEQAAFASQIELQRRLTQLEIQAQRQPDPYAAPYAGSVYLPPRSLDVERRAREDATTRRQSVVSGVRQVDDWLDRAPR